MVCAAGILDPRFELRSNIVQSILVGNPTFKDMSELVITYTDRGATDKYHSWAQKARKQARSTNRKGYDSSVARWDGDEAFRKHHNNSGWTRQYALDLQMEHGRVKKVQPARRRPKSVGAETQTTARN